MKKTIAVIIAGLILTGCGRITPKNHDGYRLKYIERWDDCFILVDTETGIGYLKTSDSGGITVMYDEDGNIYRPNGWRDTGE